MTRSSAERAGRVRERDPRHPGRRRARTAGVIPLLAGLFLGLGDGALLQPLDAGVPGDRGFVEASLALGPIGGPGHARLPISLADAGAGGDRSAVTPRARRDG